MRKRTLYLLLLVALLFPSTAALSQNVQVCFTYDANGNRISCTIEAKKIEENGKNVEAENDFLAEAKDQIGAAQLSLYPNPTNGRFIVELTESATDAINATLTTTTGAVIETFQFGTLRHDFDLSGQPAGVYFLRLVAGDETRTWKIVKH